MSDTRNLVLISAAELAAEIGRKTDLVLLHVLDDWDAADLTTAVLPGAQLAFLAQDFSGTPTKASGKRPTPAIADLQTKARAWGITAQRRVVVYDNTGGAQAARAWWTLRWAGVAQVRILDGGLKAALAQGLSVRAQASPARNDGDIQLSAGHLPTLNSQAAAALAKEGLLFDARGAANYQGDPAKPGTGHIPGAKNFPADNNLNADQTFRDTQDLRDLYQIEATPPGGIGIYCGSGNAAAHSVVALAASGIEAALYVGSWSAWTADPDLPVMTGAAPWPDSQPASA